MAEKRADRGKIPMIYFREGWQGLSSQEQRELFERWCRLKGETLTSQVLDFIYNDPEFLKFIGQKEKTSYPTQEE